MMKNITQTEIEDELVAIVSQLLQETNAMRKRDIKLDDSLHKNLGIDSISRAELFRRIEAAFDVTVPDRLMMEADTLNDIATFVVTADPRIKKATPKQIITTHGAKSTVDPSRAETLVDLLLLYAANSPDKPHIFFQMENGGEEIITYGQLLTSALRVAAGLRDRGLKEGDTVAIMQPTTPKFFYTFFGTMLAGGIPVPIYPPFRMHMLESYARVESIILRNAEARFLVTFEEAENLSRLLKGFVPSLKEVTTVDDLMSDQTLKDISQPKSDSFAFIQYTSGSTSDPKGVLLSHFNLIKNISTYGKSVKLNPDDVVVSWLPLYHDFGLIGAWLGSLYHGMPLVLLTPFSFLNHPERWLWAIHYHRGTVSGAPNFAYEFCVRKIEPSMIEGLDLSSWRLAANGAEKVYPRTLQDFNNKFAPYGLKRTTLMPVYGLAESTVGLTIPPLNREFLIDTVDRKKLEEERIAEPATANHTLEFVGCGMAMPEHEIRVVDDEGHVLPERHIGNLHFRGPSNMQGYFNNPRATAAVYHDGWIDSGDLAYLVNGEVFPTGRRKDLIIKAGRNLYPAEIEELVGNVPGIRQGCVIAFGLTDTERGTEKLVVVAETRETKKTAREKIITDINETMSVALDIIPDEVVLVATRVVPKTSSGKLQRSACKKMYETGQLGKFQLPPWMQIAKLGALWLMQKISAGSKWLLKAIYTLYVALLVIVTMLPLYVIVRFGSSLRAEKACQSWARWILTLACCPLKIVDEQHLQQDTPVIFAANHASYVDAIVTLAVAPIGTRFVAKRELLVAPIIRTFMSKLNFMAVDRVDFSKGVEDTKNIEQTLRDGSSVFIFPEGTFSYAAGLRPFRLGAFKIAAETDSAIVPIAIKGTRGILRGEEKLVRPGRITVTVSAPVKAINVEWQSITRFRDEVRIEIARHCGEPSLDYIAAQTIAPRRT